MNAQWQLNGLIVLYAALQRISAWDDTVAAVPGDPPAPDPVPGLAVMLNTIASAIREFDTETGLSEESIAEFETMVGTVRAATAARIVPPGSPLRIRLAAIAGSRSYDQHLVKGLTHWGTVFNPEIADYYREQRLPADDQVAEISAFVTAARADTLSPDDIARLDTWYLAVARSAARIDDDMDRIALLLCGTRHAQRS